ncbi:MAG: helix-turn-helix domain-containing protein [Fibrobacterota bacterium]
MARFNREELIKLQKQCLTDAAIGEKFGISRQAVHQARLKLGVSSLMEKHKDRNLKIVEMYNEGIAGTNIAEKFGISVSQTYRIIKKYKGRKKTD